MRSTPWSTAHAGASEGTVAVFVTCGRSEKLLAGAGLEARDIRPLWQRRLDVLQHPDDRADFLAARVAASRSIAALTNCPWRDVRVTQSCRRCAAPHGRPICVWPSQVHVSWSHSAGIVLAAASRRPVGCDIQKYRYQNAAEHALTPAERSWVSSRGNLLWDPVRLWTCKESAIKLGYGSLNRPTAIQIETSTWPQWSSCGGLIIGTAQNRRTHHASIAITAALTASTISVEGDTWQSSWV